MVRKIVIQASLFPFRVALVAYFLCRNLRFWIMYRIALKRREEVHGLAKTVLRGCAARSPVRVRLDYSFLARPGYMIGKDFSVCWQAPIAITLYVDGKAALGLGVELRGGVLAVRQLQGGRGVRLPKELHDWPALFVQACIAYAKERGLKAVRLYRADQDPNYRWPQFDPVPGEDRKVTAQNIRRRMRRRHDGTARQCGMVMKRRWGEWVNPDNA